MKGGGELDNKSGGRKGNHISGGVGWTEQIGTEGRKSMTWCMHCLFLTHDRRLVALSENAVGNMNSGCAHCCL